MSLFYDYDNCVFKTGFLEIWAAKIGTFVPRLVLSLFTGNVGTTPEIFVISYIF